MRCLEPKTFRANTEDISPRVRQPHRCGAIVVEIQHFLMCGRSYLFGASMNVCLEFWLATRRRPLAVVSFLTEFELFICSVVQVDLFSAGFQPRSWEIHTQ